MFTARHRHNLIRSWSVLVLGPIGAFALVGCGSSDKLEAKADELRSNPTPELATLYQRETDSKNAQTITNNENVRMISEDWGRLWLMERPSRLTPEPVPR